MTHNKKIILTLLFLNLSGCSDTSLNQCSEIAENFFGCESCTPEFTEIYMWESWGFTSVGNVGGLTALDSSCATDATNWLTLPAGAPYTYRAVLATSTQDPRDFMRGCSGPVSDESGVILTNTWANFFDPTVTLASQITSASPGNSWTGMDANGNPSANNCNDWTSAASTVTGNLADAGAVNRDRFHNTTLSACDQTRYIICVAYRN